MTWVVILFEQSLKEQIFNAFQQFFHPRLLALNLKINRLSFRYMQFSVLKLFHVEIYYEKLPFLLFSHTPKFLFLTDTVQIRVKDMQEQVASELSEI